MYEHISLFTLENKEEIDNLIKILEEISQNDSTIIDSLIEKNCSKGAPIFADVIQKIHFSTKEELDAYPMSQGHMNLVKNGPKCTVTAIDFPINNKK